MTAFFDSNVLLYVAQHDPRKAQIAERLMQRGGCISVQVLNEMAHVARRKFHYDWPQVATLLDNVRSLLRVNALTPDDHMVGLRIAEQHRLSVYDGMIVSAALTARCDVLHSEDMHAGLVIDGQLTIVNPFA